MTHVTVHQVSSKYPEKSFLNVESEDGRVGVWGCCWKNPTYLCQMGGSTYCLMVFDNQAYADEWIEENTNNFVSITRIEPK